MSVDWRGLSWPLPRDEKPRRPGRLMSRLKAEDPRKSGSLAWLLAVLRRPEPVPVPESRRSEDQRIKAVLASAEEVITRSRNA